MSSNTLRRFTKVIKAVATVPASSATYDVALPSGAYDLAIAVKSSVTGTSTDIQVRAFVDEGLTQVNGVDFNLAEPNDAAVIVELTLPAGAAGRYAIVLPTAAAGLLQGAIPIVGGVQIGVTKGGAVTGEVLEITLIATQR